ncbi:hypothetical protein HF325_000513 [Metschnikowia pulcherrima]|uniref:Uncharacterized protein n=1 Tax=Metschnikowia pulcherrima TaxID=27326 RepID=A0A8H7GYS1_9ASCO|nr:hypothetical protein HF325_000513 [Metschnikowia pulcherrima]
MAEIRAKTFETLRIVLLRAEFARAADAIGLNFNADPFWNKYLEFEASIFPKSPSLQLLRVYLRLIRIPLYQYAQYYSQFAEISKSFKISEILSPDELPRYLQVFGKSLPEELSVVEQHQLIDTFSYDIFTNTQAQVTRKWPFEAALTFQEFSSADSDLIKKQTGEWIKYLDAEIDLYVSLTDTKGKDLQYELIVSLFERALVPNCGNNKLWLRYIAFLKNHAPSAEIFFAARNDLYRKAIFTFLPVTSSQIRKDYVSMLATEKSFDDANDFLLETVRLFSGITEARLYVKSAYLSDLTQKFLSHLILIALIDTKKTPKAESKDAQIEQGAPRLKSHHTNGVSKYLNDDGICIAAVHLLKLLQKAPENTSQIRKFYNKFHGEPTFSRSVQFWRFFVEFEGYAHRNLVNLRNVIEYIKTSTALPKLAVDAFLDIYYEITCANLAHAKLLLGKENYLDILVTINAEKSDDFFVNKSARARLAKHNYLLLDLKPGPSLPKEDALMKLRLKHLPHPGVPVEQKPDLRTRLMDGEWISLLDDDIEPPLLPTFKHLEKLMPRLVILMNRFHQRIGRMGQKRMDGPIAQTGTLSEVDIHKPAVIYHQKLTPCIRKASSVSNSKFRVESSSKLGQNFATPSIKKLSVKPVHPSKFKCFIDSPVMANMCMSKSSEIKSALWGWDNSKVTNFPAEMYSGMSS